MIFTQDIIDNIIYLTGDIHLYINLRCINERYLHILLQKYDGVGYFIVEEVTKVKNPTIYLSKLMNKTPPEFMMIFITKLFNVQVLQNFILRMTSHDCKLIGVLVSSIIGDKEKYNLLDGDKYIDEIMELYPTYVTDKYAKGLSKFEFINYHSSLKRNDISQDALNWIDDNKYFIDTEELFTDDDEYDHLLYFGYNEYWNSLYFNDTFRKRIKILGKLPLYTCSKSKDNVIGCYDACIHGYMNQLIISNIFHSGIWYDNSVLYHADLDSFVRRLCTVLMLF